MARKTKKQKKQSDKRRKAHLATPKPKKSAKKNTPTKETVKEKVSVKTKKDTPKRRKFSYKETDYDKKLRRYTISDIGKTTVIIVALFVMQYILYLRFAP